MPATDALRKYYLFHTSLWPHLAITLTLESEPPLSPPEREVVKSYGGWTQFMQSYLLNPADDDDVYEAKQIVAGLAMHS